MKTAVSLDEALLQQADEVAREMGLSRSRLFAVAISEFLQRKKKAEILLQLNEVYGERMTSDEKRLVSQMKARVHRIAEYE